MSELAPMHKTADRPGEAVVTDTLVQGGQAARGKRYRGAVVSGNARLIDAFWSLLKTHQLSDLTVGMIAKEADCNRGTFYYHYTDLDELVRDALYGEVQGEHDLPVVVFKLISDPAGSTGTMLAARVFAHMKRLCLLVEHGGRDLVDAHMKHVVINLWETVLCADGSSLKPETRMIIEFYVSGVMGCLAYLSHEPDDVENAIDMLLAIVPPFILKQIASFQEITEEDLLMRLKLAVLMSSSQ